MSKSVVMPTSSSLPQSLKKEGVNTNHLQDKPISLWTNWNKYLKWLANKQYQIGHNILWERGNFLYYTYSKNSSEFMLSRSEDLLNIASFSRCNKEDIIAELCQNTSLEDIIISRHSDTYWVKQTNVKVTFINKYKCWNFEFTKST